MMVLNPLDFARREEISMRKLLRSVCGCAGRCDHPASYVWTTDTLPNKSAFSSVVDVQHQPIPVFFSTDSVQPQPE
jgi:hypothetical protein